MKIPVLYQDENVVVLDKPSGLLTHQTANSDSEETLVDFLVANFPAVKTVGDNPAIRPGLVHRLDKDTSGVIMVALNQAEFSRLKNLFQNHLIEKTYLAVVFDAIKEKKGIINNPISLKPGTTKRSVHGGKMTKEAKTEFKVLKTFSFDNNDNQEQIFSLLKVMPKTGRTHQIRVHLASIGHPILGDTFYGRPRDKKINSSHRLMLHALSLEWPSQDKGVRIRVESEPPVSSSTLNFFI